VHHLNASRFLRVLCLREKLGMPYEMRHQAGDAPTRLVPPSLRAVHPLGKSPVIQASRRLLQRWEWVRWDPAPYAAVPCTSGFAPLSEAPNVDMPAGARLMAHIRSFDSIWHQDVHP
jgi:hypothetical protein